MLLRLAALFCLTVSAHAFNVPTFPERFYINVGGKSMGPQYDGIFVYCERIPYSDLRPGMIVIRWDKWRNAVTHHRVVRKNLWDNWIAKGDANEREDLPFGPDTYIGVTRIEALPSQFRTNRRVIEGVIIFTLN